MNNNYNQYLLKEIYTIVILISVLAILAITIACFGIKYLKNRQKNNVIACGVFFIVLIVSCVVSAFYLVPYVADVKDQSYIKYEGGFYVSDSEHDARSDSKPLVKFSNTENSTRFKIPLEGYVLSDGFHEGYIVYSERSKMIVEWYCKDCIQG